MKTKLRLAKVCLREFISLGFQPCIEPAIFIHDMKYFREYNYIVCSEDEKLKKLLYKVRGKKFLTTIDNRDFVNWYTFDQTVIQFDLATKIEIENKIRRRLLNTLKENKSGKKKEL